MKRSERDITNKTSKAEEMKTKLKRAKQKFDELLPELLCEHKGKYVAIVEGHVEIGEDRVNGGDHRGNGMNGSKSHFFLFTLYLHFISVSTTLFGIFGQSNNAALIVTKTRRACF